MSNPIILDHLGNSVNSLTATRGINESARRKKSVPTTRSQVRDFADLYPENDIDYLVSGSRCLYENNGIVRGAIKLVSDYSVGDAFNPISGAKDKAWADEAEAWLSKWYGRYDVKGGDFKQGLKMSSISLDRDGGSYALMTQTKTGYPQIQHIPSHRIGTRNYETVVETGRYNGLRIHRGVITNKYGRVVAYRVLGSEPSKDKDISARSLIPLINPNYQDQNVGIPSISHAINDFRSMQTSAEYELHRQQIESSLALIVNNEDGAYEADSDGTGATKIEQLEGGKIVYLEAGTGQSINAMAPSGNPSDQFLNFQRSRTRQALVGMGLNLAVVMQPEGQGTANRAELAKADKAIQARQTLLKSYAYKQITYGLSMAIQRGDIPPNEDWLKWGFTTPKKLSIDMGHDCKSDALMYEKGFLNLTEVLGAKGITLEAHLEERAREASLSKRIAHEESIRSGYHVDARDMGMKTPNDQPDQTESNDE